MFCLILLNLWSKVELGVAVVIDWVFDNDGNIRRHGDDHSVRKLGCLGKEVEVTKSKVQLNRFVHVDNDRILFLFGRMGSNEDVAVPDGPTDTEANPFFSTRDGASISKDLEVTDDSLELRGRHLNGAFVGSVRNTQLFTFNIHELQVCEYWRGETRKLMRKQNQIEIPYDFKIHKTYQNQKWVHCRQLTQTTWSEYPVCHLQP
jgi:hypothetical protein